MSRCCAGTVFFLLACASGVLLAQAPEQSSSSSAKPFAKHVKQPADSAIEMGSVSNGVYRNKMLGLTCKVPDGWVLRTDEMNAQNDQPATKSTPKADTEPASSAGAKVLLAAFSRPPEARGAEVNGSIVIAAESISAYPGLKEAAQYLGPLTEVAEAQGFSVDDEPTEIEVGTKTLVREDFHKDVGNLAMRQSSLVMLARGYAISITLIGGTEDEVDELIDGLDFHGSAQASKTPK